MSVKLYLWQIISNRRNFGYCATRRRSLAQSDGLDEEGFPATVPGWSRIQDTTGTLRLTPLRLRHMDVEEAT
jgi:hypothetical protein